MKKLLYFLAFIPFISVGQQQRSFSLDTTAYRLEKTKQYITPEADTVYDADAECSRILQHINRNKVPTGVLLDQTPLLSNMLRFCDTCSNVDTSNPIHMHQLYYEYGKALVNGNYVMPQDTLAEILSREFSDNLHPLILFKSKVATFRSDAVSSGALHVDSSYQLREQSDTTSAEAIYAIHDVTAVCLGANDFEFAPGIHQVKLDPRFLLGNDNKPINSIMISFSNQSPIVTFNLIGLPIAGYSSVPPAAFNIGINDSIVFCTANVGFLDGTATTRTFVVLNSKFASKTTSGADITIGGCNGGDQYTITGRRPIASYMAEYDGSNDDPAIGTYYVFYSDANCGTHKVTKPVIFIDGYDPSNGRDVKAIYDKYLNKRVVLPSGADVFLADKLRADGYDIIILDYKDGGANIERNAALLATVLNDIYARWPAAARNVLIGPSMGAIVAQYCLTDMERGGEDHHVRTFISFDGPHGGANVSLGAQKLIDYITSGRLANSVARGRINKLRSETIDNEAARQMLSHHLAARSESAPAFHNYRNIFQKHLGDNGWWPSNCRRVAIINGNSKGVMNTDITGGSSLLSIRNTVTLYVRMVGISIPITFDNLKLNVYATRRDSRDKVMSCYSFPTASILSGAPVGWTNSYHTPGVNETALDIAPGSSFNAIGIGDFSRGIAYFPTYGLGTGIITGIGGFVYGSTTGIDKSTFIPTISSADYYPMPIGYNVYKSFVNEIISGCGNNSSFDWVYAEDFSQPHVAVTSNIAQWFISEIEQLDQNLGIYHNYISGPGGIAYATIEDFHVTVPTSGYCTWTVSSNLQIEGGQGTRDVGIMRIGSGLSVIQCEVHPSCANDNSKIIFRKKVWDYGTKPDGNDVRQSVAAYTIMPNPSNKIWSIITSDDNKLVSIKLFGLNGAIISSNNTRPTDMYDIECEQLPTGAYIAVLGFENGLTEKVKLLKQ